MLTTIHWSRVIHMHTQTQNSNQFLLLSLTPPCCLIHKTTHPTTQCQLLLFLLFLFLYGIWWFWVLWPTLLPGLLIDSSGSAAVWPPKFNCTNWAKRAQCRPFNVDFKEAIYMRELDQCVRIRWRNFDLYSPLFNSTAQSCVQKLAHFIP